MDMKPSSPAISIAHLDRVVFAFRLNHAHPAPNGDPFAHDGGFSQQPPGSAPVQVERPVPPQQFHLLVRDNGFLGKPSREQPAMLNRANPDVLDWSLGWRFALVHSFRPSAVGSMVSEAGFFPSG